jgi:hypothetical protein
MKRPVKISTRLRAVGKAGYSVENQFSVPNLPTFNVLARSKWVNFRNYFKPFYITRERPVRSSLKPGNS